MLQGHVFKEDWSPSPESVWNEFGWLYYNVIHAYVKLFILLLHLLLMNTMDRMGGFRGYSIKLNCLYSVLSHNKCAYGLLRPACPGYCEMKLGKVTKMGEQ